MERIPIAELKPELPSLELKQIRGVVILVWPYSSSQRQFAFLLGEPDFRLRQKNGQVRVRFSGSSARSIASTGVGIGDDVVLSLRGVEFVGNNLVNTPGKSINWELAYTQTLSSRIERHGKEIAELDLVDVAPTPAPHSPIRSPHRVSIGPSSQWSSPAFLKRTRLSDGPFFEPAYNPFYEDIEDEHAKKRRRRSYRDWDAWRYLERTPSPSKEDAETDVQSSNGSPIPSTHLPETPLSPPKLPGVSTAGSPLRLAQESVGMEDAGISVVDGRNQVEDNVSGQSHIENAKPVDNFARDADYYELYAGPDEHPPTDHHIDFEGDTEPNTDEEESSAAPLQPQHHPASGDIEETDDRVHERHSSELIDISSESGTDNARANDALSLYETNSIAYVESNRSHGILVQEPPDQRTWERSGTHDDPIMLDDNAPQVVMPPPTLSLLQTDFQFTSVPGMLTPIGKEPSSPNLLPLDSSTLPMPSPFPGERDGNVTCYLDFVSSAQQVGQQAVNAEAGRPQPDSEADYIMDTSFYSSVSSSRAPAFHPTHESAFTEVRFTFGLDGSGLSRPQASSEEEKPGDIAVSDQVAAPVEDLTHVDNQESSPLRAHVSRSQDGDQTGLPSDTAASTGSSLVEAHTSQERETVDAGVLPPSSEAGDAERDEGLNVERVYEKAGQSTSESQDEMHETQRIEFDIGVDEDRADGGGQNHSTQQVTDQAENIIIDEDLGPSPEHAVPGSPTPHSPVVTEVIDLGSPSEGSEGAEGSDEVAEISHKADPNGEFDNKGLSRTEDTNIQEPSVLVKPQFEEDEISPQESLQDGASFVSHQHDVSTEDDHTRPHLSNLELDKDVEINVDKPSIVAKTPDSGSMHQDLGVESKAETIPPSDGAHDGQGDESSALEPTSQLPAAASEEGHQVDAVQPASSPGTSPASNTRAKAKASMSPKRESQASPRTPRSRKKNPPASLSQRAVSPEASTPRSTVSSTNESFSTSPYSLRSQSKLLSPTQSTLSAGTKRTRLLGHTYADSSAAVSPQQASFSQASHGFDFPYTNLAPSQELGTLQGKFANVAYVKDSEEDSVHSENSLSTVQISEGWNTDAYANLSDSVHPDSQERGNRLTPQKARPASHGPGSQASPVWKGPRVVISRRQAPNATTSATQAPLSSPTPSARSANSLEVASSSPRRSRRLNKDSPSPSVVSETPNARTAQAAEHAVEVAYPMLPTSPRRNGKGRSLTAQLHLAAGEQSVRPTLSERIQAASTQQHLIGSNLPMTPEDSQNTLVDSQPSFLAVQEQNLPITPQLTQSTSAALQSFKATDTRMEDVAAESLTGPSAVDETTSRRNATATDVASPSGSPRPSVATTPEEDSELTKSGQPSIGLSTPISYYTPLKDLPYFLNRSSSFHSAGSPDVLALVTTASTPPARATKGPKHHTTTLHITDISIYPSQTTVQIFRAYANALPVAEPGDVVLLRAFNVRSLNRHPCLVSADESAWCVWRYGKPLWGRKKGAFGEVQSREEVKGPEVERGEGEWSEVERLRAWYISTVKEELEEKAHRTRSKDKSTEVEGKD